jgi:hypothetical protein
MTERNTFFLKKPRVLKIINPIAHKSHFFNQFEEIVNSIPTDCDGCIVYGITKRGRKQPLNYVKGKGNLPKALIKSSIQLDFYPFPFIYAVYTLLIREAYTEIQLRTINY